jgi:hypothetical protein
MKNRADMLRTIPAILAVAFFVCGCGDGIPQGVVPDRTDGNEDFCSFLASGVSVYKPDRCYNGYTLLSSFGEHESPAGSGIYHGALLVDMDGRLVHEWSMVGFPSKMLLNGHVLGYHAARDDGTGHQEYDYLVELDWHGNEVWRWDRWGMDAFGRPICRGHHDFQREGYPEASYHGTGMDTTPVENPRTLLLVHETLDRPEIAPWPLESDVIIEVDPRGNILWEWHATDHFEEFGFDEAAKEALRTVQVLQPEIFAGGADVTDWLHTNAISYLGPNRWWDGGDARFHPENILADSRNANILWIIDRATGEIVWKVGPDYGIGRPEKRLGQIIGQHHAHMIAKGLPGEGNILVFDNGGGAGYGKAFGLFGKATYPNKLRTYSRVIEFNPVTLDLVWEYKRPSPAEGETYRFYSFYISNAQRLPNGNTLVNQGDRGRIFEVTDSGELVWEYLSPYHDWTQDTLDWLFQCETDTYRAYRIPYDFVPRGMAR